ncbi:MAG: Large cysteine-rich periplasmic protein OmcB precursor [Planctomycetota bacterium]
MQDAERPSRQELVVPQRQSSLPLVLGAMLCAGTGFGLVWALGLGRGPAPKEPAAAALADAPHVELSPTSPAPRHAALDVVPAPDLEARAPGEPARFPRATHDFEQPRAMQDRGWRAPPADTPADDRYPTRPATLESPEPLAPRAPAAPVESGSRFAPPRRFPDADSAVVSMAAAEQAVDPGDEAASAEPEPQNAAGPAREPATAPENAVASAPAPNPPEAEQAADAAGPRPDAETEPRSAPDPQPSPDPALTSADLPPPAAAPLRPSAPFAAAPPPLPPAPLPPAAPSTAGDPAPRGFAAIDTAPPASFRPAAAAAPTAPAPPAPAATIRTSAANPFATAPPMGPPPGMMPPPTGPSTPAPPGGTAGGAIGQADATGQGRPGPMHLEGLQTPQLAVEKRGPREIQVGKTARYEIFVRNVGSAPAHDVLLRDAVPYGTTLVATTPPASPTGPGSSAGGAPAELAWSLGTLPPGADARVSVEVMPQIEGEIGSVASVSFRTDATVRSRATKPALRLEASETQPVRIGGEIKVALKVSNPGTGVATGVVIEGVLPEGVTHSAGHELEFDVGQLKPGESRTIDLVLGSRGPGVHTARFAARADGQLESDQPVRLEVTAPTLELTTEMPSRRYLQRPATCTLSMINAGTAPARAVELVVQLPAGMKFVRANHAGWYEERSHRVLWSLEELPPAEVGAVEMVLMPVDLGPQKIVAAARSADGPSAQASHTVEVEGLAALAFEVTDSEDPIEVGGLTEYVVRVGNQGTKAASGVRLTATLLGELEPVEAKGPGGHRIDNLSVVFEPLAKLAPSEEAVYRVRVRGRREGDQRMQVQVVSDDHPAPITKEEITRVYADR